MWLLSNQGYKGFESRKSILFDILDVLTAPNVNMIGVYGIGGIGKTTLMHEVLFEAKKEKLFDQVVFVLKSSTANVEKIQDEIAEQLGLELCKGTESERARTLFDQLWKEKILIILDDIWANIDLETVGILFGGAHRGCDCVEDHDLESVAIQVANDCGDQVVKSAFLLCGLLKQPYDAPVMDLLKYGMGLGLFEGIYTMQERRDKVYALVHRLKDSCLLLDSHSEDWFSMHDIVRDVSISIASRDHHVITVRNDVLVGWLNNDVLKNCSAVSLNDIEIGVLPKGLEYPQLEFFYQCVLGDISIIGNLEKLENLSLVDSDIEWLPNEIGELTQLRLLDLSSCWNLKVIPPNVISKLTQLEELYMGNTFVKWEFEGKEGGAEASATFVFPKVIFLKLWNLSELRTFYSGLHTSEWPLLKRLELPVKILMHADLNMGHLLAFKSSVVISNLEELKLGGKDITMICQDHLPKHLFQNLKSLESPPLVPFSSHLSLSPPLMPSVEFPSFSLVEAITVDEHSPTLFGSNKTQCRHKGKVIFDQERLQNVRTYIR
ncbi:Disease resistance protein [Citrus sinensis]|nr:Disease resistance protein [Citrus sinensis]